jgi:plastocyanin
MKKNVVLAVIIILLALAILFYSFDRNYQTEREDHVLNSNNLLPSETIEIKSFEFSPSRLVIHEGEKVIWINKDNCPHTITSLDKELNSAIIPPNGTYTHLFEKEGRFPYNCSLRPTLAGEVIVKP